MNWEICWAQKSYKGKIYLKSCFQLLKKTQSGKIEKTQQVHLGDKEGERISAIRITVIHDAENLDTFLYWNSQQVKK